LGLSKIKLGGMGKEVGATNYTPLSVPWQDGKHTEQRTDESTARERGRDDDDPSPAGDVIKTVDLINYHCVSGEWMIDNSGQQGFTRRASPIHNSICWTASLAREVFSLKSEKNISLVEVGVRTNPS